MSSDCSYIIPFKFDGDRLDGLLRVVNNIKSLDIEIILVEQISNINISDYIGNEIKHIKVDQEGPFNKSKLMNIGYKSTNSRFLIFGDADCLIDPKILNESINFLNDFDFVCPKNKVIDLDINESDLSYNEIYSIDRFGRDFTPTSGGLSLFERKSFEKIKGWPEEFIGWGKEDYAMDIKINSFLKSKIMENNLYHLYHKPQNKNPFLIKKNFEYYSKYYFWDLDQLKSYIDSINL
jgi:predicted glycosyltransferase involved in capsule biosynthesis